MRLVLLANDITLRNLIPAELAKGFGFFHSKPATAFSPLAVTPDELGPAWRDGRVHLRLRTTHNGQLVGDPDAGPEMHFSFFELIAHVARTRDLAAGTILGGGTVSNVDPRARRLLPGRAAGARDHRRRQTADAVPGGGRHVDDRDARRRWEQPVRAHRTERGG